MLMVMAYRNKLKNSEDGVKSPFVFMPELIKNAWSGRDKNEQIHRRTCIGRHVGSRSRVLKENHKNLLSVKQCLSVPRMPYASA